MSGAPTLFLDGRVKLHAGDCFAVLDTLPANSIDAVVTDPPYHLTSIVRRFGAQGAALAKDYTGDRENATGAYARASRGFMGKQWDGGDIAFRAELWRKILRVLKPGGHVVAFSGTRTYHRMAVAIEDAGFEIRDQLAWAYGSGFPKSHDVSKAIDKAAGLTRDHVPVGVAVKRMIPGADQHKGGWEKNDGREYQPGVSIPASDAARAWEGWGTALKPAWEPICFARKPLIGTVVQNVLAYGVGALNIDGCRVETDGRPHREKVWTGVQTDVYGAGRNTTRADGSTILGRWPANIMHDGSDGVVAGFPDTPGQGGSVSGGAPSSLIANVYGERSRQPSEHPRNDSVSAARFFYTAKADADDRLGSKHPTVKPVDLMRWLVRLICPKGGTVLDPFAGTGTTGQAAFLEGCDAVLIEREEEYRADIARRMALVLAGPDERTHAIVKAKGVAAGAGPLFGDFDAPDGGGGARFTATSPIRTNDRADGPQMVSEP